MTRCFIDNQEVALPLDILSLDQILKYVEDVHLPPNTVVRQIHIDGLPLTALPDESPDSVGQIDRRDKIELFTGTVTEVARDSISEALEYLDRVAAATPSLAMSFQISPGPEAFENLRQLYDGLYWLNVLLDKLEANFQINLKDAIIQGVPAPEHHQKFIAVLKQMIESQESGDFILIADLLEYEILPLVPVWKEMFGIVAEKVNSAH